MEKLIINTPSEGSNDTYPLMLMLLLFYLLCCCCVDCLKISMKRNWNLRLADNWWNKRTTEALIVNIPSEGLTNAYPLLFLFLLLLFYFLCCFCVDCFKVSAKKWNWRLVDNRQNKRTAEALIVNTLSGDLIALTLWFFCCWCSIFVILLWRLFQ